MENLLLELLRNEVKPAMGCTEPVAIALAVAHAVKGIDRPEEIHGIQLIVSTNILKNALNVGVPRTKRVGLEIAAALGVFADYQNGLNLLGEMSDIEVANAHRFQQVNTIAISRYDGEEKIYIEAVVMLSNSVHRAILSNRHDRLSFYSIDDEIFYQDESQSEVFVGYKSLFDERILSLIKMIDHMSSEKLMFLMEGYAINKKMAEYGLEKAPGLGLGLALMKSKGDYTSENLLLLAMQLTAAASDARMAGANLPVMTSNGSGNNGLTAVLPIVAANLIYQYPEEALVKALAMSHLVNSYIKNAIGRLSPICACGVASATGAAVGIAYLMELPLEKIPHIIDTMIANLSGMACDGAKLGCALKLSTAAAAAVQSVYLLKSDSYADFKNGIVGKTPEESIANLGKLAKQGMAAADEVMTDIMLSKF